MLEELNAVDLFQRKNEANEVTRNPDAFVAAEKLSKVGRALALLLAEDVRLDHSPGIFWTDAPGDKAVLGTYELYKECAEEYLEQAA